jgi:hypothetical protein
VALRIPPRPTGSASARPSPAKAVLRLWLSGDREGRRAGVRMPAVRGGARRKRVPAGDRALSTHPPHPFPVAPHSRNPTLHIWPDLRFQRVPARPNHLRSNRRMAWFERREGDPISRRRSHLPKRRAAATPGVGVLRGSCAGVTPRHDAAAGRDDVTPDAWLVQQCHPPDFQCWLIGGSRAAVTNSTVSAPSEGDPSPAEAAGAALRRSHGRACP